MLIPLMLFIVYPGNSWSLTIIENGKVKCIIVRPANATKQEESASKDLQIYLQKISGAKPEIISEGARSNRIPIYVGACNATKNQGLVGQVKQLKDDGYIIKVTPDSMCLVGKDPLATRFAVFGLLEDHLGVRWYMPGDIGEVVPYSKDVILNEGEDVQEPSFPMRWIGSGDWALSNRMNVKVDSKLGMHVFRSCHTFSKLCPVEKYFDNHPEYFALVDGERKKYEGDHGNQLCTSNPEVIRLVAENACKILEDRPELDVMTIFPNDGLGFCECESCKALDEDKGISVEDINKNWRSLGPEKRGILSRRMAIFYDEVARRILSKHPEKYVQCGAYSAYRIPPENLNIKAPNYSIVEITHGSGHDQPIESGSCNDGYRQAIDGWKKKFASFSVYEYYWKLAANELPYPIVHSIRKDIPYFHKKGCFGLYTQYSSKNVGTLGLNYYVAAKLLWNVNADVDKILDDFYHKFYGPAWEPMKGYYETLEKAVIDSNVHLPAAYHELPLIFNKKILAECELYLSQAKAAVQGNEIFAGRTNMTKVSLAYVKLAMNYLDSLEDVVQKFGWNLRNIDTTKELEKSRKLGNKALQYLEEHESSNCFKSPITNYVKRFLNPEYAIRRVACYGNTITLDKAEWVIKQKKDATTKEGMFRKMRFDIWIYGYDFDRNEKKAEHQVYLIDRNGKKVRVGELASSEGGASGKNRCFVIKGIDSEKFICDRDILELHIVNPKGDWIQSIIYAFYIMPHNPTINSVEATNTLENEMDRLHEQSFGFIEYCYYGIPNNDGETLKVCFTLYDESLKPPHNLRQE